MVSNFASARKLNSSLNRRDRASTRSLTPSAAMGAPGGESRAVATRARDAKKWMMTFFARSSDMRASGGTT